MTPVSALMAVDVAAMSSAPLVTSQADPVDLHPSSENLVLSALASSPQDLLLPTPALCTALRVQAKRLLDPVASMVASLQEDRLRVTQRKRKRGQNAGLDAAPLRLKQLYLDGLETEQIWEQAKRILEATSAEVERGTAELPVERSEEKPPNTEGNRLESKPAKMVRFDEEGFEMDSEMSNDRDVSGSESDDSISQDETRDSRLNGLDGNAEENMEDEDEDDDDDDDVDSDGNDEDMEGEDIDDESASDMEPSTFLVKDRFGLNDGFFSIDDFNRDTAFLEQQDARGDPDDGAASDEEDVDWDADPLSVPMKPQSIRRPKEGHDDTLSEDEDDGPRFEDADLNAPFDSSDEDGVDVGSELPANGDSDANANDVHYSDFFAPPAREPTKSKKSRKPSKKGKLPESIAEPTDQDIQRTISAVKRDIFSDDDLGNDASDLDENGDRSRPGDRNANLSSHERRRARLASQIRELEAAAVSKREWTLSGEVNAAARPLNSLLEEDLEFERAGKPVPIATAETSTSLEDLIKSRILARQFDEVRKRRPTAAEAAARRGLVAGSSKDPASASASAGFYDELLDPSSGKQPSLAALYEADHLKRTDPQGFTASRDAKLRALHQDVEASWRDVCARLDALSSLHFRPRPPEVQVRVVSDVPRVQMEEARPAGIEGGAAVGETGLAPQEVYKVGETTQRKKRRGNGADDATNAEDSRGDDDDKDDNNVIVTKGGTVLAREEMTREQKLRRRRREKERSRKRMHSSGAGVVTVGGKANGLGALAGAKGEGGRPENKTVKERDAVAGALKRAGVRIIGKRGELLDVHGKEAKNTKPGASDLDRGKKETHAASLKL